MADGTMSLADIAAIGSGGMAHGGGWMGAGVGFIGGLILASIFGNGGLGFGGRGAGFANAIGYENLATSNEVQRGFDNQNSMANQREILGAVNQNFHDTFTALNDKYGELARDIAAVQVTQAQALANQNQCCCDTKLLITETTAATNANIAQSRYDAALATANTDAKIAAGFADLKQTMAQDKIEALQGRIAQLELAQATSNIVRYPSGWTYNAGTSPFCGGCGCGMA